MVVAEADCAADAHDLKEERAKPDMQSCIAHTACSMSPTASEAATTTSPACVVKVYYETLCYSLKHHCAVIKAGS